MPEIYILVLSNEAKKNGKTITVVKALHCKYIRPDYDGTLAIQSSSTMIHCRDQLQRKIWKFLI